VHQALAQWAVAEGRRRKQTDPLRHHFPSTSTQAEAAIRQGLPPFLRLCGDMGRAGLRLLAPRLGSAVDPQETCVLCNTETMTPAHLLNCAALPLDIKLLRAWAIVARTRRIKEKLGVTPWTRLGEGYLPPMRRRHELAMEWEGMSSSDLADHLWWVGRALDLACSRWKQRFPPSERTGLKAPPLVRLAGEKYNMYHPGAYRSSSV
jgi:hypothetical protein